MVSYEPGGTLAHRLDPRSKLAFQAGFALGALSVPLVPWLAVLAALSVGAVFSARLRVLRALWAYRAVLLVLGLGPVIGGVVLGPPWVRLGPAVQSLGRVLRLVPVLLVSAAFVRSTPVRDTRAAIQRTVPGRAGQLLGVGVALTVRLLPALQGDLRRVRAAIRARNGGTRSLRDRAGRIVSLSVGRALGRSERLSVALRARCFAYNPTLPELELSPRDYPVFALAAALALAGMASI